MPKERFSDVWKNFLSNQDRMSQPHYSFTDSTDDLQNTLTLDVLSEYQEFDTLVGHNVGTGSSQQNEPTGYQCYSGNNGLIRTYSGEMTQQISQQNTVHMMANNHPMPMHHMNYQSTSPNNGDGSNSTHNSPFAPSPSQGFDYPTSPHVKPSIPSNTDYPGDYNFTINFGEATESAPKSAQYTYSHSLNKLFVKMNVTCPIRFKCDNHLPMGCTIRAVPVFKRPEHVTDVVTRCPNHKIPDEANFVQRSGHLIRAEMPEDQVRYDVATDSRESVSVRYERPQIGAEYSTILYKFMCLSSCVGGINRRPLLTLFILENPEGVVLGRRVVEVRICSCPGRDRSQEEKRKFSDNSATTSNGQDKNLKRTFKNLQATMEFNQTLPGKKKRSSPGNGDLEEEFILRIRGRENYMMLRRIKEALELMEYLTPQQLEAYRNKEDQDQALLRQQLASNLAAQGADQSSNISASSSASVSVIPTVFSVSDPLTSDAASASLDPLLTPSHSSQPLTATPTGMLTTPQSDASSLQATFPGSNPNGHQQYWAMNGTTLGSDVPDSSRALTHDNPQYHVASTSWGSTLNGIHRKSTDSLKDLNTPSSSAMSRELSGASTVSVSSSSSSPEEPILGRYVTKVLLRQTLSLNREQSEKSSWKNRNEKESNEDFVWEDITKTVNAG